jgi:1-acyl-sn-glycerol-3-phosphate acyltransferase
LLLACNHPNSFLDAIIIDIIFEQPVYSLTRGDVFINPFVTRILSALKMLPVYRVSEGVENLSTNYATFKSCKDIFKRNGVVQIFSEGLCINEWHLRPLKKGTARLALSTWEDGIDLKVLPIGINYSSFKRSGKNIFINAGRFIMKNDIESKYADGKKHKLFNDILQEQLSQLVFEIKKDDRQKQELLMEKRSSFLKRVILFLPAVAGWLLHFLFYLPLKMMAEKKAGHNDHYDSVLMVLLLFTYPFYILFITLLVFKFSNHWASVLLFLLFPLTAWAYVQLKPQLDK